MLNRLLLTATLDGQAEALTKLHALVKERRPDGVLFAGRILGSNPVSHAAKLKMWKDFFAGLGKLGVVAALVPGASDVPLREFLQLAKDAEIDHPNIRVAHATLFEEGNLALCGLAGDLTEAEDRSEDRLCYARASADYFLRTLWRVDPPYKVLLLSVTPHGKLGGETGNRICDEFIDSYHPSLCLVAGATERRGFERIAHTLIINPGRLADGSFVWLDRNRSADQQVEFCKL
jgi:Icc-related predicted phosphoesterase